MKKIAITALGRRGAGPMYSFEMAKALSKKVQVLSVISSDSENIELWRNEVKSNPNFSIYEISTYNGFIGFIFKTLCFWRLNSTVKKIQEFNPDVLYSPFGHFWDKYIYARVKCKVTIKTYHDMTMHEGENDAFRGAIYKFFSYKTDKAVILSEIFRKTMTAKYTYKEQDIVVIPHACFNQYGNTLEPDFSIKNRVLFFGRIVHYKGLHILLKAWPHIIKKYPRLKLVIAGNGNISDYSQDFANLQKSLDLNIRWIQDNEVGYFFQNADLTILPYIEASQSGVIPLANSFGIPAIATNIGGLPNQISDGETGLVIESSSIDSIAGAIISLYDDPNKLIEMKKRSYDYSKTNTWDKSAEILLNFLESGLK